MKFALDKALANIDKKTEEHDRAVKLLETEMRAKFEAEKEEFKIKAKLENDKIRQEISEIKQQEINEMKCALANNKNKLIET